MTATHNIPAEGSSSSDGLPKSFVCSMRTLFDIMDDQHTGYVRFTEIERRWHEDGTQGLPRGVLASLRKVTPPNGYLSFDRFCAGLKMCLLNSKGREDPNPAVFNSIQSSCALSPTNSLEAIPPPLTASSPQSSPQHRNRPLSAPLLDKETFSKQTLTNNNIYNGVNGNRKNSTSHSQIKVEKGGHYHQEYASQPNMTSSKHKQSTIDSKIYVTKSDIRMGIGGIKGLGKCPPNNSQMGVGPPKPPRAQEGERGSHILDRNNENNSHQLRGSQNDPRMTNSLERESRSDRKWNRAREEEPSASGTRRDRGGSLERLLDAGGHRPQKEPMYGPPLNRTGMRSALQSWFKERSKSDLQQGDTNNNYNKGSKRFNENHYKDTRVQANYPVGMESTFRGIGDGGDGHRNSTNKHVYSTGIPLPPGPNSLSYNKNSGTFPLATHIPISKNSQGDAKIYGKVMENAVAIPANYNSSSQGPRSENVGQLGSNGAIAHGLYVAPQPPQLAVHKKTAKKKEPRRHTLQNGVDQNVMKRLRQLEAERDMLYQGLDVVERARAWYKQQLQGISERIHYLPFGPTKSEPSLEAQQEKLHFQLARIHEINAHLRALMDASEKGLPAHMNLAIRNPFTDTNSSLDNDRTLGRIKQQNKLLTEEVSGKSERITALEREKAALLRELFQARASQRTSNADSTFM